MKKVIIVVLILGALVTSLLVYSKQNTIKISYTYGNYTYDIARKGFVIVITKNEIVECFLPPCNSRKAGIKYKVQNSEEKEFFDKILEKNGNKKTVNIKDSNLSKEEKDLIHNLIDVK